MRAPLPELLESLACIFGIPGGFPRETFAATASAKWASRRLATALRRLAEAPPEGLDVAYADHFLYSSWQPVLHLEASVYRHGHLCDQDILEDLKDLHRRMGVSLPPGRCPDHLASGLEALAWGLRSLGGRGWSREREAAVRTFANRHLLPQVEGLLRVGIQRPMHPVFEGALEAVALVVAEILEALSEGTASTCRPSCTS